MNKAPTRIALVVTTTLACAALNAGCEAVSSAAAYRDPAEPNLRLLVLAELRESQRLGLVTVGEEDVPSISESQRRLISQAVEEATVGEVDGPM